MKYVVIQDIQVDPLLFFPQLCLPTSKIDNYSLHKVSTLFLLLCLSTTNFQAKPLIWSGTFLSLPQRF